MYCMFTLAILGISIMYTDWMDGLNFHFLTKTYPPKILSIVCTDFNIIYRLSAELAMCLYIFLLSLYLCVCIMSWMYVMSFDGRVVVLGWSWSYIYEHIACSVRYRSLAVVMAWGSSRDVVM